MAVCIRQLQGLLDSASDPYLIFTPDGRCLYANPALHQLLGYSKTELKQRSFFELLHPNSRDRLQKTLQSLQTRNKERAITATFTTKDGELMSLSGRISHQLEDGASTFWSIWRVSADLCSSCATATHQETVERSNQQDSRYRMLVENQTEMICCFLSDGTLTFVNQACCRYFDQPAQELIGTNFLRFIAQEDGDLPLQHLSMLSPMCPVVTYEHRMTTPTGEVRWQQWTNHAIFDNRGRLVEYQAVGRDITDLKQAEAALRVSEERLRLALEASQIGIWDCNLRTGKVTWSDNVEKLFGLTPGEFNGRDRDFLSCVHPDDRDYVFQASRQAICQRSAYDIEFRVIRPNNEVRWIASKGQVLYSEMGKPVRMTGINLDITNRKVLEESLRQVNERQGSEIRAYSNELTDTIERLQQEISNRKQVEHALRESEERYRSVIAVLQEGIVLYDGDGSVRACNASAERILGRSAAQIYGSSLLDSSWQAICEDGSEFLTEMHPATITLRTGRPCSNVVMGLYKPNGGLTWISMNSQPLFHIGDRLPYAAVISFSDITARKQTEMALQNSEALYRAIVEDQTELVCRFLIDGTLTFVNDAYCRVLGIPREELIGHNYRMFLLALDSETETSLIASLRPDNAFSCFEHQVILPTGEVRWQQWNSRAIFDDQGNFIEFQAVGRDITDRKLVEEALRDTTDRLNGILQSVDDVVWSYSPDNTMVYYISPAAEQIYGYSIEKFYCNPNLWLEVVHPQDKSEVGGLVANLWQTELLSMEYRIVRSDETTRWLYHRSWLIRDNTGKASRIDSIITDITERKLVEAELRLREARYVLASCAGQVGVWDWNLNTNEIYIDPHLKQMLGYQDHEVRNHLDAWLQLVHPEDLSRVLASVDKHLAGQVAEYELEYRMIHQNGTVHWFLTRGVGLYDTSGRPYRMMGTNTNITDRKQAEEQLRRQHQRSQLFAEITLKIRQSLQLEEILHTTVTEVQELLQADRVIVYRLQPNGSGTVVQEAVVPGYTQIHGQNIFDPCFTKHIDHYRQGRIKAISNIATAETQPCHIEFLQQFEVKANLVVPILQIDHHESSEATLWGLLIVHQCDRPRDWSEFELELLQQLADQVAIALAQSQLLESLRESEERFYGAFEHTAVGMAIMGLEGQWLQVNPALCRIVGYSETELLAMTSQSITYPDDLELNQQHIQQVLAGKIRFYHLEKRYFHKDGHLVWIALSVSLVRDAQGQPLYFVSLIQDITERKQAEEEILKALAKEKELNELKSRFVSMISHEFRTPLTTIQSAAELLEHYEWSVEQRRERFQQIHASVQHMIQLLEDVLLIGKSDADRLQLKEERLNLPLFCQTLIADLQLTAGSKYCMTFTNHGEVQDVLIDSKLLRQILTNLLSNAIKYSPDGGNVSLELACEVDNVILRVKDQGIGIPPENRERLFEVFYRAINVDTIQGTGLGLAIVKRCVDLYKGHITLESEIGVGTTFTVTLPLKRPGMKETNVENSSH
ncbi:PAS domain S-box protein [Oscillatoria sp. FACHB-1407]|uniref:PAS domain S-box protein n=1 Tax=Oscillatoria sp. FACHB-1407 TaxID=2692847 RepID=UPI001688279E|nr:PAS domain S-box protein [Oscillatoria sp. FACHB-1407]MBD2461820.1 PAS domain S-box protein [Oscillatoria sp. FACHB-1407]